MYENPWIVVEDHEVIRPDGVPGQYGVVSTRHPAVFVVALTDADEVLLVEQFRYPTQMLSLEVPAGSTDGQEPLLAAQRELAEETGFQAETWTWLGTRYAANGVACFRQEVFLAQGLSRVGGAHQYQLEEGITAVRAVAWDEALQMVRDGRISDGETIGSLLQAALALGRVPGSA